MPSGAPVSQPISSEELPAPSSPETPPARMCGPRGTASLPICPRPVEASSHPTIQTRDSNGSDFAKSTAIPRTDRLSVGAITTGLIARVSASIVRDAMPRRLKRASTTPARRLGSPRTSRAGTTIGSSDVELTKSRRGRRSTTIRLTYQSPNAVSDLIEITLDTGSALLSLRVGRSITMVRPRARRLAHRSTAYRARSRLEPSKVRVSSRRSEPGGRVSNARTPSPTTPAPIMKCNSSTKPWPSRSFQRR